MTTDLRTALSAVADQLNVKKTKRTVNKKRSNKQHRSSVKKASASKSESSEDKPAAEHKASDIGQYEYEDSNLEDLKKHKVKITNNLAAAKKAYKDLQKIYEYYSSNREALVKQCDVSHATIEEYSKLATELISNVRKQLPSVTQASGLKVYIKRLDNECKSLLDGLSEFEVPLDLLTLSTLDNAIARVRNLIRIYTKKVRVITDNDESAINLSDMMQETSIRKKISECTLTDADNLTIISGYSIIPLGSFSAKLLKQYFDCDVTSGYPVLHNQSFLVVSIADKSDSKKKIDLDKELDRLSNKSSPFALVSKMPKQKDKFYLYWIMTQRNLNSLKKSAAYQDYMMLHDWAFL